MSASYVSAAWQAYQRMRLQLNGRISRELYRSTGLSEADFDILFFLEESPDGSVRSIALRCGLEWEKSRLSHQLRRIPPSQDSAATCCAQLADSAGTS